MQIGLLNPGHTSIVLNPICQDAGLKMQIFIHCVTLFLQDAFLLGSTSKALARYLGTQMLILL